MTRPELRSHPAPLEQAKAVDPLAHTLVGAALAETGLGRTTRLATVTLIVGANLPDIDAFVSIGGEDTALLLRRGLTHGVVALLVLPWLLAAAMWGLDHWRRRSHPAERTPASFPILLGLSYVGVLSHPLLDWLNTYGIRLLKPFSDRWFYGDTLFIIDPWMWLLAGSAVVLAHARSRWSAAGWAVLGTATTALVLLSGAAPPAAMILWCVAVLAIVIARLRRGPDRPVRYVARVSLTVLAVYVAAMFAGTGLAERQTSTWAGGQGLQVEKVMAGPLPANPFRRDVVIVSDDRYHFVELAWFDDEKFRVTDPPMPRLPAGDPVIAAALASEQVRGFRNWMRFPSARTERLADGYRVELFDVRYSRGEEEGIGYAVVELDDALRPRAGDRAR